MVLKRRNNVLQAEIWLFDPDPVIGTEIGKKVRPGLILSCNSVNKGPADLVIIVPITSQDKGISSHVRIDPPQGGLQKTSFAACEQIRAISKERLIKKVGTISSRELLQEVHGWVLDLIWLEI